MDFEDISAALEFAPLFIVALFSILGSRKRRKRSAPRRPVPRPGGASSSRQPRPAPEQTGSSALEALLREYATAEPEQALEQEGVEEAALEGAPVSEGEIRRGTERISPAGANERRANEAAARATKRYWRKRLKALRDPTRAREAIVLSALLGKPKAFQKPFS